MGRWWLKWRGDDPPPFFRKMLVILLFSENFWRKFVDRNSTKVSFSEFLAWASKWKGLENSKNGFEFLLGQNLREQAHFEISKFSNIFLNVIIFHDFFENIKNPKFFVIYSKAYCIISTSAQKLVAVPKKLGKFWQKCFWGKLGF